MAAAAGAIAGGVIAGAGSAVAGALGGSATQSQVSRQGLDPAPASDPALAIATFDTLLSFGILEPRLLTRASPLATAVENFSRRTDPLAKLIARRAVDLFDRFEQNPEAFRGLGPEEFTQALFQGIPGSAFPQGRVKQEQLAAVLGQTVPQLFEEELAFRQRIEPVLEKAEAVSEEFFQQRLDVRQQLTEITRDLPDVSAEGIETLRDQERTRLRRDINAVADERELDLLRTANAGGFNPGRALGELEEARFDATQDADLDALQRALALIGGRQAASGGQIGLLQSVLAAPQSSAAQLSGIRTRGLAPGTTGISSSSDPSAAIRAGVEGAGALGTGIANAGILADDDLLEKIFGGD